MVIFYRVLNLCGINAYILFNQHQDKEQDRGKFLKKLSRSLVVPHMQRRVMNPHLPNELVMTLKRVLGPDMPFQEPPNEENIVPKRKTCKLCPPKIKRKTTHSCVGCKQPICLQCFKLLCKDCQ
ncbi:putative transposase yabusame-W [Danaus plexippus plexippus]|uniref:Transposase yabusame-W n=1 Tax=Danaus plexippus plexippus TaxID=278856 RepID=A0A212F3P7_DANPL|nr:putative transposase yabusame-W [Danaus plexippus plexippus]